MALTECPHCGKGHVCHIEDNDGSPYPTQEQMNAEDARDLYRLGGWLHEHREDTRLAGEDVVDWAIRLLDNPKEEHR